MICYRSRFFQDAPGVGDNYGVGGDDEGGVGDRCECVGEGDGVDVEAFHHCGLEDVFKGPELDFIEVFGFLRGCDFEVGEQLDH